MVAGLVTTKLLVEGSENVADALREQKTAIKNFGSSGTKSAKALGVALGGMATAAIGAATAIGWITKELMAGSVEAGKYEKAVSHLKAGFDDLANLREEGDITFEEAQEQMEGIFKASTFTRSEIVKMQSAIGRTTKNALVFERAVRAVGDVAATRSEMGIPQVAQLMTTILGDVGRTVDKLRRFEIQVTPEMQQWLEFMKDVDEPRAQQAILDMIMVRYGGGMQRVAETAQGQLEKVSQRWNRLMSESSQEFKESFIPVIQLLNDSLDKYGDDLKTVFKEVAEFAKLATEAVTRGITEVGEWYDSNKNWLDPILSRGFSAVTGITSVRGQGDFVSPGARIAGVSNELTEAMGDMLLGWAEMAEYHVNIFQSTENAAAQMERANSEATNIKRNLEEAAEWITDPGQAASRASTRGKETGVWANVAYATGLGAAKNIWDKFMLLGDMIEREWKDPGKGGEEAIRDYQAKFVALEPDADFVRKELEIQAARRKEAKLIEMILAGGPQMEALLAEWRDANKDIILGERELALLRNRKIQQDAEEMMAQEKLIAGHNKITAQMQRHAATIKDKLLTQMAGVETAEEQRARRLGDLKEWYATKFFTQGVDLTELNKERLEIEKQINEYAEERLDKEAMAPVNKLMSEFPIRMSELERAQAAMRELAVAVRSGRVPPAEADRVRKGIIQFLQTGVDRGKEQRSDFSSVSTNIEGLYNTIQTSVLAKKDPAAEAVDRQNRDQARRHAELQQTIRSEMTTNPSGTVLHR